RMVAADGATTPTVLHAPPTAPDPDELNHPVRPHGIAPTHHGVVDVVGCRPSTSSESTPQDGVVFLETLPIEPRLGSSRDGDALWDDAPDRNSFCLPPGNRLFEIVRPEPSGADDDTAGRAGRNHLERHLHA